MPDTRPGPDASSTRTSRLCFWLPIAVVLAADQITKWLATAALEPLQPVRLVGSLFQLTYVRNAGAAFSLLGGPDAPPWRTGLLIGVAVATIILLTAVALRQVRARRLELLSLGLIVGGAAGNLIDRATAGTVVDFLDMGIGRLRCPVYNLADASVFVGVCLFIWLSLVVPRQADERT